MLQFEASLRLNTAHMAAFPTAIGSKLSLVCPFLLLGRGSLALGMSGPWSRRWNWFARDKREQQLPQGKGMEQHNCGNRVQCMPTTIHTD